MWERVIVCIVIVLPFGEIECDRMRDDVIVIKHTVHK